MLSTTHTLACPTCGRQATIQVHTTRNRRATQRDEFEPQMTFTCRNHCTLEHEVLRLLCGLDVSKV